MPSSRARLILAIALLAPVLLYWGAGRTPVEPSRPPAATGTPDTDFYLRDARIHQFDREGRLHQELVSPQLEHYPEPGLLQASRPGITLYRGAPGGQVRIDAQQGQMHDSDERIDLTGDVRLQDLPDKGAPMRLETPALTLMPQQRYAETDAPVALFSQGGETRASGMKADLNERKVELLSDVEGRYESN